MQGTNEFDRRGRRKLLRHNFGSLILRCVYIYSLLYCQSSFYFYFHSYYLNMEKGKNREIQTRVCNKEIQEPTIGERENKKYIKERTYAICSIRGQPINRKKHMLLNIFIIFYFYCYLSFYFYFHSYSYLFLEHGKRKKIMRNLNTSL